MTDVTYLYGSEEGYQNLPTKDEWAFYKTEKNLYLGEWQLSSHDTVQQVEEAQGALDDLQTDDKTSLVNAINELVNKNNVGTINIDEELGGSN